MTAIVNALLNKNKKNTGEILEIPKKMNVNVTTENIFGIQPYNSLHQHPLIIKSL